MKWLQDHQSKWSRTRAQPRKTLKLDLDAVLAEAAARGIDPADALRRAVAPGAVDERTRLALLVAVMASERKIQTEREREAKRGRKK